MGSSRPRTGWLAPAAAPLALLALLVAALVIRLAVVDWSGHSGDVVIFHRWAERLAEVGPWGFYEGHLSVYPALLYAYWPLGLLLDGEALDVAIKGLSVPFDLALGALLFAAIRPAAGNAPALGGAALYLLNPAVLIAGPIWGQVDAAGTLAFVAALLALARQRWALSGTLAMLAGLAKPQFGLVALPVLVMAVMAWRSGAGLAPLRRVAVGAIATYAVVAAPLLLDPLRFADQLYEVANFRPLVSLYAPNPWGLLFGFEAPDGGLLWIGAGLLALGLVGAMLPLRRGRDLGTLLAVGALVVFAFYFLPTRSHERYLFPALALLAPFAAVSLRFTAAYLLLTAAFALSLLYALAHINPGAVPQGLRDALLTTPSLWGIGLGLAAGALAHVWLMARGRPSLAPRTAPVQVPGRRPG
ncbi:MAG: hypothetical protein ACRDHD_09110 [Candidatus Limnocylindria bacterium]